ncbi:MAG: hypothetical protein CMK07_08155 [Ponticaulis sp.]|nr:hypothetical protein [Ponticaulis sp.]
MTKFQFEAKWKEELVVTGPGGCFCLVFSMGCPTVYLPDEHQWTIKGPAWAKDLYSVLKRELQTWCNAHDVELVIDEKSVVF